MTAKYGIKIEEIPLASDEVLKKHKMYNLQTMEEKKPTNWRFYKKCQINTVENEINFSFQFIIKIGKDYLRKLKWHNKK